MSILQPIKGAFTSGTGALNVPVPTGYEINDLLLLFITSANQAITTPSGWTQIGDSTSGNQAFGTAAAISGVRFGVYYKYASYNGNEASVAVADTGDFTAAIMLAYRGVDVATSYNGGTNSFAAITTAGTAVSFPTTTTNYDGCMVIYALGLNRDTTATTNASAWAASSLASITEVADAVTASGNGGGFAIANGIKNTAG